MKLLIILPSTERGGTEEYALTIASAAVANCWDVCTVFPKREFTASLVQSFENKQIAYYPIEISEEKLLKFKTLRKYIPHFIKTIILLIKIKPDVVQINLPLPECCFGSILACALMNIPAAVVFHLIPSRIQFNSLRLKIYKWAHSRNQLWIGVSKYNCRIISESFEISTDQIGCIYNGSNKISKKNNLNLSEINRIRYELRKELKLTEKNILALTVGRLNSQKGHIDLISAIPKIVSEFPNLRFIWAGDGEERENLIAKVREYNIEDKVIFLGHRSDISNLLSCADYFIFPSRAEGQPFALIEAMAYGVPIIASDTCGIPELIKDKEQGLLFPTSNINALLEAMRWALNHPERMIQMGIQAKIYAQNFSEEKMVTETLSKLSQLYKLKDNTV